MDELGLDQPLSYRDVYDRWQRSKSFGDPRDLPTYSKDLNEVTGTTNFNAGIDPGWWTRASTAADVNVFEPVARATGLEAAGRGIGSLFGPKGEEIGGRVARGLPRTVAQTLPLVAAEFIPGLQAPATYGLIGTTGALFGAQTYAETGSPTAAAISGVTAAALPGVGKIGGEIGARTLGPEVERVLTQKGLQYLPKEAGNELRFKAAKFLGSQVGMVGTLEGSSALQAKALGQPFDPLSPEFLAQQIPFSLLDLASTARGKVPTATEAKLPIKFPGKPEYVPPAGAPEEQANLQDMLDRMTSIAKDQNVTPEEKSKAFSDTLKTVINPLEPTTPKTDKVIIIGHPKVYDNSIKVLVTQAKGYDVAEPGVTNVWINNPESATQHVLPDGSVAFVTDRKNINTNVKYPAGPNDFPAMRRAQRGEVPLPEQAPTVTGPTVQPETDLLSLRQKFQATVNNDTIFQAALGKEPKNPDKAVAYWTKAIDKMTPEHLKPGFVSPFDAGLGSTVKESTFDASEQQVLKESGVDPTAIEAVVQPQPVAPPPVTSPWTDEQLGAGKGEPGYVPTVDLIAWAKQNPDFQAQVERYKAANADATDMNDAVAMEEIAHRMAYEANAKSIVAPTEGGVAEEPGDTPTPEWLKQNQRVLAEPLEKSGVADQIEELAAQRKTAQEIATQLGVDRNQVVAVRAGRNIPSQVRGIGMVQTPNPDFDVWLKNRAVNKVKASAQKIESAQQTADTAQQKIDLVPQSVEDVGDFFREPGEPEGLIAEELNPKYGRGNPAGLVAAARSPDGKTVEIVRGQQGIPSHIGAPEDWELGFVDPKKPTEFLTRLEAQEVSNAARVKLKLGELVKEGATPVQAVERARLQTQTPVVDKSQQQVNLEREALHQQLIELSQAARGVEQPLVDPETGKPLTLETERERELLRAEANKRLKAAGQPTGGVAKKEGVFPEKPAAIYDDKNAVRDTDGKPFKTRELAEAFKEADPDLADYTVRDQGKGKGFTLARQINKEEAIGTRQLGEEPTPEEKITTTKEEFEGGAKEYLGELATKGAERATQEDETTAVFTPEAESRPDVSFNDYLGQLDLASENPLVLRNAAGFDDLPTAITAIRQFRTALTDVFSQGKEGLKEVNAALKKAGVLQFDSEKEMVDTFKKMRSGLEEFTGKYRNWNLDSKTPHDPALTQEIGILHPERGLANFLDWFIANTPLGDLKDLVTGLRNTSDFSHVKVTNVEGKGFWWNRQKDPAFGKWVFSHYKDNDFMVTVTHPLPSDSEPRPDLYDPGRSIPARTTEPYRVSVASKTASGEWIFQDHRFATPETLNATIEKLAVRYVPNVRELIAAKTGFIAADGRPVINLNRLPSSREDALGDWGGAVLEEISHDTLSDLRTRTDPAAVEFKATLERILKTLRDSKQLPSEVRKAVQTALKEGWYGQGAEHYNAKYDAALPGRDSWKNVHYSLMNAEELIGGIFSSPELRRIMMNTTMPKSPVPILNFFANAWARMFGYTPNAGNAFAKILASYDNYLSGTRNARGYNGNSYIRDSLVGMGTTPQQMASRINAISELYNTGDIVHSITGFEREMGEGLLPATTVAGPLNEDLKTALSTGDAKAVGTATDALLAGELPQTRELWWRMREDLKIARDLYDNVKKGDIYAEFSVFQEGLKNQAVKLNALNQALTKQEHALGRWNTMDSLGNSTGMERLWSQSLQGEKVPKPTEQTGNEDVALQALGLSPKSMDYIAAERRRLATTGEKPLGPIERMFKFASFVAREIPIFGKAYGVMHESQALAHRRMTEMEVVRNSDPRTKGWSKPVADANMRVAETPGLNDIYSDMRRRANVLEKMRKPVTFDDPEMQAALRRASDAKRRDGRSDRQDIMTAFNSESARFQYRIDKVIPEHLDIANRGLTAIAIIGREIGMPVSKALDLSEQLHSTLKQLRDPAQQVQATEMLKQISTQMQPDTFMKVLQQTNGFINDAQKHLEFLQKNRHYTGEQRYGKFHLVMSREGEPYREGFMTEKAARARAKDLATDGWILEDIVPKEQANVAGYLRAEDPLIASQRELDQQTLNRLESVIADLPADRQELLRPLVQRAAEYEASAASFSPVPTQASPRRKFRAGRETIDMMANAGEETKRLVNWMRHRESRIMTTAIMLDPDMLANRGLKDYTRQFVDNQLAADNPIARRFNEAAFYWYLAANFGNDVLESMQTLTTGMASVISETGSIRDAGKYIAGASGKVLRRYTTGKWGDKNTEWFINRLAAEGSLGLPTWGDLYDPTTQNYFEVNGPKSPIGKTLNAIKNGFRGYKAIFLRHNDMVGGLAGFQLGQDMGMGLDEAYRFAVGVKDRGLYTGGKVQRPVGFYSMKEKAVPQLMGSLKTYMLGWFSQLAHNYKIGFAGAPGDFTPAQRLGAKKAFLYLLGSQATLAGSLGLPGIGQGLALLKQSTGVDLKGWTRQNLAKMFGEDQDDYGGFMTGLALHGLLSQAAPFDISGRQVMDVPFTGVSSWKGFDVSNILPVPFSMASDFIGGLNNLAKGGDPSKAFPIALRGPVQLIHGEGDIRNSKGDLLYKLSPIERFWKTLGLESTRVAAAKEVASTVQSMNDAAEVRKTQSISAVADLVRRGDTTGAQRRMVEIKKANPDYDMVSFVRSVAREVEKKTMPYDWRREVNPALDFVGLGPPTGQSSEVERLMLRRGVTQSLGLHERPTRSSFHHDMQAASLDELMNSDPYLSRSAALQRLLEARQLRRRSSALELPEFQ